MDPIKVLKQLIEFRTYQVTPDRVEGGMKDCAYFLETNLKRFGFTVKIDELFNITAERAFDGEKSFLINTHFDTIPPSMNWDDALIPKSKGKRLYGLGASDAKGGIAAILTALSHLDSCKFAKLIVQFMNYEDNAITFRGKRSLGVTHFLSKNPNFTADYGINVEPTVVNDKLTVSIGCMGRLSFTIKTIGKEVHSGTPHLGRNAIYDMAKVIEAVRKISPGRFKIAEFEAEMPINIATIQGGRAINIVPGECNITCERRTFPGEDHKKIAKTVSSTIHEIKDVKVECIFNPNVQLPYIIDKDEDLIALIKKSILKNLGYRPDLRIELGRTDSVYLFHNAGIKTVIVGPGHMGHSAGEYINIDRLVDFTRVLSTILEKED